MTKLGSTALATSLSLVLLALTMGLMGSASPRAVQASHSDVATAGAVSDQQRTILVDDFAPQPIQGNQFWPLNRLGGDRGRIDGPGSGSVESMNRPASRWPGTRSKARGISASRRWAGAGSWQGTTTPCIRACGPTTC
jgi:hypothetical protein